MTSHPLELPEIIARVGFFLPLWSQERALGTGRLKLVFLPKTYLTCLLVSKLWHDTLLPLLWSYYDAEAMGKVPFATLTRYCTHFRTFCQYRSYASLITLRGGTHGGCTRLVNATMHPDTNEELEESQRLVRGNGGLRFLEWHGPLGSTPLVVEDFGGLGKLKRLNLSRWDVSEGRLWGVLESLAGSLKVLEIDWLTGVNDIGNHDDNSNDNINDSSNKSSHGVPAMLPLLESYRAPGLPHGPDPVAFVKRCPNLVRLVLSLDPEKDYSKDGMDITCLADSIRQFCPNLRALTIKGYITPDQKATLIRNCTASTRGLSELVVDVYTMGKNLMDSMAVHAPTLETLGILTTTDGETVKMRRFLELPVQCPRLKWFAVNACYNRESARSTLGALKAANWQCSTMEVLDLDVGDPSEEQLEDKVYILKELFATGPILGWYFHPKASLTFSDYDAFWSKSFCRELFESVQGLTNLRMIKWCGAVFTRSKDYNRAFVEYTPLLY